MSDNLMQDIARMRDEIKLHIHLGKAETRDLFAELERKWETLQHRLKPVKEATREAAADVGQAVGSLLEELYAGYKKVEQALKSMRS